MGGIREQLAEYQKLTSLLDDAQALLELWEEGDDEAAAECESTVVQLQNQTERMRLVTLLTGEYDYSCTVELSEATAAKIPGVRFQAMQGIGHFPFAENPKRFAEYLLPILAELKGP